jgi:hypothetical protein
LRNLTNFGGGEIWPGFVERGQSLAIVGAGPRFKVHVTIQVAQTSFSRFAKRHLCRDPASITVSPIANTLPVFFQKLSQPRLSNLVMGRAQRFPDFPTTDPRSRVIPAGLDVSDKILFRRLSPYLRFLAGILVERISTL